MISQSASRLIASPPEILSAIIERLEKRELKTLRLTCHDFRQLTTPHLYDNFPIYPHWLSLQRAEELSKSPIRYHVHKVVLDTRYRGVPDLALKKIDSVWSRFITDEEYDESVRRSLHDSARTVFSNTSANVALMTALLSRVMRGLTNVTTIELYEPCIPYYARSIPLAIPPRPAFYTQMLARTCDLYPDTRLEHDALGIDAIDDENSYMWPFIFGLMPDGSQLTRLSLHNVNLHNWNECFGMHTHAQVFSDSFCEIRHFELTVCRSTPATAQELEIVRDVIDRMRSLETLRLTFRSLGPVYDAHKAVSFVDYPLMWQFHSIGSGEPFDDELKNLKDLTTLRLQGLVDTPEQFKKWLVGSCSTLMTLELADLIIVPDNQDGKKPCLVKLLKWIQHECPRLSKVSLKGIFFNCGTQQWWLPEMRTLSRSDCLRTKVEKWLVAGGACPLDPLEIQEGYIDFGIHDNRPETRLEAAEEHKFWGDVTLQVIFPEKEHRKPDYAEFDSENEYDGDELEFEDDDDDDDDEDGDGDASELEEEEEMQEEEESEEDEVALWEEEMRVMQREKNGMGEMMALTGLTDGLGEWTDTDDEEGESELD